MVFKHLAHELTRANVPKLAVCVSGCPPPRASAWVLGLILWIEADDVVQLIGCKLGKVIFEEVFHFCNSICSRWYEEGAFIANRASYC